jgi:hypothetical protein
VSDCKKGKVSTFVGNRKEESNEREGRSGLTVGMRVVKKRKGRASADKGSRKRKRTHRIREENR